MDLGQTYYKPESVTPGDANGHVADVILRAEQELHKLIEERAELTKRINAVKQTIAGLAHLFGDGFLDANLLDFVDHKRGSRQPGITSACRRVLMEARRPMSARDVCDEIQRKIPDFLSRTKHPMGAILCILGRLEEYGEATVLRTDRGQRTWLWAAPAPQPIEYLPDGNDSITAG
jgi:hypothetical protein